MFVVNLPNVYLLVSHNTGLSVIFSLQKAGCPKEPENIHKLECNLCSFSVNGSQYRIFSQVVMEYKCTCTLTLLSHVSLNLESSNILCISWGSFFIHCNN